MTVEQLWRDAKAKGMWIRVTSPWFGDQSSEWFVGLCPHGTSGWNGRLDYEFSGCDLDEALTIAGEWLANREDP